MDGWESIHDMHTFAYKYPHPPLNLCVNPRGHQAGSTAEGIAKSNGNAALAKILSPAPPGPGQKPAKAGRK